MEALPLLPCAPSRHYTPLIHYLLFSSFPPHSLYVMASPQQYLYNPKLFLSIHFTCFDLKTASLFQACGCPYSLLKQWLFSFLSHTPEKGNEAGLRLQLFIIVYPSLAPGSHAPWTYHPHPVPCPMTSASIHVFVYLLLLLHTWLP